MTTTMMDDGLNFMHKNIYTQWSGATRTQLRKIIMKTPSDHSAGVILFQNFLPSARYQYHYLRYQYDHDIRRICVHIRPPLHMNPIPEIEMVKGGMKKIGEEEEHDDLDIPIKVEEKIVLQYNTRPFITTTTMNITKIILTEDTTVLVYATSRIVMRMIMGYNE